VLIRRVTSSICVAGLGVALSASAVAGAVAQQQGAPVEARRLAGADRYATAAAIARATFPDGGANVVVARGDLFPDALSAVNVAGSQYGYGKGAVLLTPRGSVPEPVAAVIRDLTPHDGVVIGTRDVVGAAVEGFVARNALREYRVGGADRYSTNRATYTVTYNGEAEQPRAVNGLPTALLVSGADYADAVAAGPVAYKERVPLLLTAPDRLPASTRAALADNRLEQVVVVGGPSAVSPAVVRELEALGLRVRRVAGASRQETAIRVFEFAEQEFGWTLRHVNLARGDGFADALAGGPHAGEERAPVLLTADTGDLSAATRDFLRSRAGTVASIDVLGGRAAVSDAVVQQAQTAATTP